MAHQWDPQQILEAPLALELIQEQFPHLSAQKIRLLGAGWDNTAFVIDETLIFRFPRREIALPLLEAEWSLLPQLAPLLPSPIPIPKWRGAPTSRFPWPFIGYPMLYGFTACHANLPERQREALAEPLALFLRCLHSVPKTAISGCPIPQDALGRMDAKLLIGKIIKNGEELALLHLLENRGRLESIIGGLGKLRSPFASSIVHGDLYVRHLLVDKNHRLVGVIDWGDLHLGDPAIDLSIAHSFLPESAHNKFRETYGNISEETWSLALLRAFYSSTMLILYGYHSRDSDIFREGMRSLKRMISR